MPVNVPEETRHGAAFGESAAALGGHVGLHDGLLTSFAYVERGGDERGDGAGAGAGDEGVGEEGGGWEFGVLWGGERAVGVGLLVVGIPADFAQAAAAVFIAPPVHGGEGDVAPEGEG